MGNLLSYAVNSGVNLPIYYFGGTSFRLETKSLIEKLFPCLKLTSRSTENSADASNEFDKVRYPISLMSNVDS